MEHTCGTCERHFRRKAELDRHTKRQNPCKPPAYTCECCGKGFASYQTVWRHKKTIHQCRKQQTAGEAQDADTTGETQNMAILREALEHTQAEAKQARDDADRLQAEADRLRTEHKANTDKILELEAAYDNLVELQNKTMCKLAEWKAQDTATKKAMDDALQALAQGKQRIATLESQNEQLRESLAEQLRQEENRPTTQQKSKKRKGRKK